MRAGALPALFSRSILMAPLSRNGETLFSVFQKQLLRLCSFRAYSFHSCRKGVPDIAATVQDTALPDHPDGWAVLERREAQGSL